MTELNMQMSDALAWVKKGIENERYTVAIEILDSLILQQKKLEANDDQAAKDKG